MSRVIASPGQGSPWSANCTLNRSNQVCLAGWKTASIDRRRQQRTITICSSSAESQVPEEEPEDIAAARQRLSQMASTSTLTGEELRELVMGKWNRLYEVRLQKRGERMYLHVMWKYLGQRSFRMTEDEYNQQLDAVAEYITIWGAAETVRRGIDAATWAPGFTIGGGARAFSIPLGVDLTSEGRGLEF